MHALPLHRDGHLALVSLDSMTTTEKLALLERLWDDLSRRPEDVPSPAWHGTVLAGRIAAVREGRTAFVAWEDARRRLQARFVENEVR